MHRPLSVVVAAASTHMPIGAFTVALVGGLTSVLVWLRVSHCQHFSHFSWEQHGWTADRKESWWRKTLKGALLTDSDPHRAKDDGTTRRNDTRRKVQTGYEELWQAVATERARWAELEAGFIQKVLRRRGPAK